MLIQQLQLTEEELNSLMQECNLSDMDLLELGNIKELMLQATDAGDMTALLTDEGLYLQSKSVEAEFANIMQTVQETLDMNPEEVQSLMQQVDEVVNDVERKGEEPILVEVVNTTEETSETKVKASDKKGNAEQNMTQENNLFAQQNQMTQRTENVQTTPVQTVSYTTMEAENIMRQIMDHMQIQLNADSTELNMQLHPESLGTLQIRISAKEGIMTAQFTTTSETVKSVLEGQMIQLQQQFDQQNIKVEAIEVTVQSHAFESALEKGNEHQAEDEETKRNRTRRIDLNLLDGSEEVETEDRILAEMMEVNGNSVDYLV
jgi:flagellar hook-length control protein FliK